MILTLAIMLGLCRTVEGGRFRPCSRQKTVSEISPSESGQTIWGLVNVAEAPFSRSFDITFVDLRIRR